MKKIMLVLFALVLLALSSFALAEDTNETVVDDELENETEIEDVEVETEIEDEEVKPSDTAKEIVNFNDMTGAEVRMYQLLRSIDRNILFGREIISRINSLEGYDDIEDRLEEILESMALLRDEVKSYNYSDDLNVNVKSFVAFKQDSISLTKDFRDEVRTLVNDNNAKKIREQVRERVNNSNKMKEHASLLKQKVKEHNENATRRTMEQYGILNETIINRIRNQEIEPMQIREQVLSQVRSMQNERELLNKMNEDAIKARVQARQNYENNMARVREQQQNRIDERMQLARENMQGNMKDRVPGNVSNNVSQRVR